MALTRPKFSQFDTTVSTISDPLTILNKSATIANVDVGFIINRNGGGVSNVAFVWQESTNQFILAATSSSGSTNANITVTSYSNLQIGNVSAITVTSTNLVGSPNVTVTGSMLPSANVTYDLGSPTQRWRSGWFSGTTIYIGSESISAGTNGNWTLTSAGSSVTLGVNANFVAASATIAGNVISGNVTASGIVAHGPANYVSHQYVLYGTSTNATEIELLIDGANRMPVASNTTVSYEVNIASRRTDAVNESAAWMIQGVADDFAGTVANVGNIYEVIIARDDATWVVDARADNTNKTINIYVTGAVGKTIRWVAVVKTIEVTQ